MRIYKLLVLFIIMMLWLPSFSHAIQRSRPLPIDPRFRVITYHPNDIHHYVGYYDYQASIVFEEGEVVETISMGNTSSWQIVPSGSRLFIRPIADNPAEAKTNMLLITNKRIYYFILEAAEAESIDDKNLVFETKFLYPENEEGPVQTFSTGLQEPDLTTPEKYNFNYSIAGSEYIAPLRIFDDGEFTYFQFPSKNATIPAFFLVDSEGRESLINYRVVGNYIVVERVSSQFTLRNGPDVTCVFNETWPLKRFNSSQQKRRP